MRISDWSSDVCSSDLGRDQECGTFDVFDLRDQQTLRLASDLCSLPRQSQHGLPRGRERHLQAVAIADGAAWHRSVDGGRMSSAGGRRRSLLANAIESIGTTPPPTRAADGPVAGDHADREKPAEEPATPSFLDRKSTRLKSEEHTSEIQSLMRISYTVLCLKTN